MKDTDSEIVESALGLIKSEYHNDIPKTGDIPQHLALIVCSTKECGAQYARERKMYYGRTAVRAVVHCCLIPAEQEIQKYSHGGGAKNSSR